MTTARRLKRAMLDLLIVMRPRAHSQDTHERCPGSRDTELLPNIWPAIRRQNDDLVAALLLMFAVERQRADRKGDTPVRRGAARISIQSVQVVLKNRAGQGRPS